MSLQQINYTQIRGGQVNVLDVGIVPNDNTKRAANTAILLATLAKTEIYGIEFPQGNDTYYFDAFTLPDKVIYMTGHTTLRGNSGTILDILGDAVTNVAINTPTGPQLSRFSRFENLIFKVPLTATVFKINNGGLMMNQIWVTECNIGLHIIESYGASYTNIGISAVTAAIQLCDGATGGFVAANNFTNLVLNNYCGPTASPGGGTPNGKGLWINGNSALNNAVTTVNTFQGLDCSSCGWGVYSEGVSRDNSFIDYYAENNQQKNIEYIVPSNLAVVSQTDSWINNYYGGGVYTPTADVYPTYAANQGIARTSYGVLEIRQIQTPQVYFTNNLTSPNVQTLDYYEEGTWTPQLIRASTSPTLTYTTQSGTYVRIGKLVTAYGKIVINTISAAGVGANIIKDLPQSSNVTSDQTCGIVGRDSALTTNCKGGYQSGSFLYLLDTAGADINENYVAGGTIEFSITYFAAS
jgi:hypothetical protein